MAEIPEKCINEAKQASSGYDTTFCIGTSLLNPAKPFMDLWYQLRDRFKEHKAHLVPFEDERSGIISEIEKLGIKFDFLVGVCDSKKWLSLCRFLPLGKYRLMVAMPREHRLAAKSVLEIKELFGETIIIVKRGDSETNDTLRHDIETNYPEIKIEDAPQFYDMSVFNHCAESGNLLLTCECWSEVHPALATVAVNWDYKIPYGLLYSKTAPSDVIEFVNAASQILKDAKH